MKILKALIILLGGGEQGDSLELEENQERVQVIRYNGNNEDVVVAHRGKLFHTSLDEAEKIIKDRTR